MQIGPWDVRAIETGRFRLDGGAMFGVVPKVLWQKDFPADADNRVELSLRSLYLEGFGRRVLVDTGMGDKWTDAEIARYALTAPAGGVRGALSAAGVDPDTITDVILTHLHFDHAGGTTRMENGVLVPAFPQARHHVQRRNVEWANKPNDRERASYRRESWGVLEEADMLELRDGTCDLLPGVSAVESDGHTEGLQMIRVSGGDTELWYPADLVPTAAHVSLPWIAAYDISALRALEEKRALLDGLAGRDAWIFFEHDPRFAAARVERAGDKYRPVDTREDLS
jgi:glyoxylase-like metal-dependent hydrolase (beta-lactamase superfamily II)